jgi:hypothetical protein
VDPNGAAQTTLWTYYTDSTDTNDYSQLESVECANDQIVSAS